VRPIGKTNVVGLLMLIAAAGCVYWAIIFGPVYVDNFDVKDIVNVGFNSYGNADSNIATIRAVMRRRLDDSKFGMTKITDPETGEEKEKVGLPITDEQIITVFDEPAGTFTVRVEYDREVVLIPTDKVSVVHFVVERSGPPGKK